MKLDQEKEIEGFNEFDQTIKRLCNQMALTEAELYVSRGDQILGWIKSLGKAENPGRIYDGLKKYFEKELKKAVVRKSAKKKDSRCLNPNWL